MSDDDAATISSDDELARMLVKEFDEFEPVDKQLVLAIPGHQVVAQRFRAIRMEHSELDEIVNPDDGSIVGISAETRVFFLFEVVPPEGSDVAYQEQHDGGEG